MLDFAAGSVTPAASIVVATHLAACSACAASVELFEAVGGQLLSDESDAPLSRDAWQRIAAAIERPPAAISRVPTRPVLPGGYPCPAPLVPYIRGSWRWLAPGMRRMRLMPQTTPGGSLTLYRIAPGVGLPHHGHKGQELTCVLTGSFMDGQGRFACGDLAETDESVAHHPVAASGDDCICVVASAYPLQPLTPISRLLQPILRF